MATTATSFNVSCPTMESPADFHNQTINNITESGNTKGWESVFKDPIVAFLVFFQILLCLIIYVGNTITMSAMSFAKKLKNNMQNKYIYSLAVADQLTGFNLLQLLLKNYFLEEGLWISCQPHLAFLYTANAVSLMTMLSIAVDRYFYIVHPFVHIRHVTSRRITILILVQWALAVLYGCVPIYVFNADESKGCNPFLILHRRFIAFSQPIFFFIDCFGIGVTYCLIAKVARQHYNKKNERIHQINAAIVHFTTHRRKSAGSGSTAAEREQNTLNRDAPMFGRTELIQDVEIISKPNIDTSNGILTVHNDTEPNIDTSIATLTVHNNSEANIYTSNKTLTVNNGNEANIDTSNGTLTVNNGKEANIYTSNGTLTVYNNSEANIDTSNGTLNVNNGKEANIEMSIGTLTVQNDSEANIDTSNGTLTVHNDSTQGEANIKTSNNILLVKHNSVHSETTIYTGNSTESVKTDRAQGVTNIYSVFNTVTVNNESDANIDKSRNTLIINYNEIQNETYLDTTINLKQVNCNNIENDSNFDKSNNTEITSNGAPVISVVGNNIPVPDELPLPHSFPQANPWSLASLRWMKQMIVVFGLFVLCWTPSMVCIFISAVREPDQNVVYVLGMFGIANSAVNVFVYSICNKTYSAAIKTMCRRCRRK